MRVFHAILVSSALAFSYSAAAAGSPGSPSYPPSRTVDQVDDYHGTVVTDPYRWLEDIASDEVKAWVEAQNALTFAYLDRIDGRDRLLARMRQIHEFPRYSMPYKRAGRYFYAKNDGLQNQWVTYWTTDLDDEPKVLLDPNTWSADGTIALAGLDVSEDGKRALFGRSTSGSDWSEWQVMDIGSARLHKDLIRWSKGGAQWNAEGTGFYYERFPEPKRGEETLAAAENGSIWFHRLGTEQSSDTKVFDLPEHPDWLVGIGLNEERSLGLIYVTPRGAMYSKIYVLDVNKLGGTPALLIDDDQHEYSLVNDEGDRLWFSTTKDAPRGRLILVDRKNPAESAWQTIIPEGRYPLQWASYVGGELFVAYLKDARTQILRYDLAGRRLGELRLPGRGTAYGFGGRKNEKETFYAYTDFVTPMTLFHYDIASGQSRPYKKYEVPIDTSQYESRQVFCRGVDGMAIPMFLTYKKGLKLDGANPTMLYAYGGFGGTQQPYFSTVKTAWYDMGGVYAVAGIRGGAEYGEEWHLAGSREGRPLTFQDMIACAEWLIDEGYTQPARLALNGGSQGGMMVGAVVNARPDLFGVAIPMVGVMDMLRFNQWGFGAYWEGDYGSPQDPAMFPILYSYSPYHNLKAGTRYPAMLITTADTDDRVMPAHSFKYAARLQASQPAAGPPVLLRVETKAGHGGGKPLDKALAMEADVLGFTAHAMGVAVPVWR